MNQILKIERALTTLDQSTASSLKSLSSDKISTSLTILKDIFLSFYELGISEKSSAVLKSLSDAKESKKKIVKLVTKHSEWIQHYVPIYARGALDFQSETSDEKVYEVRSGIEFLFSLFKNHSPQFELVLSDIKTLGSVEDEFDENLKLWLESGAFVALKNSEIHRNVPESHWWWFKST